MTAHKSFKRLVRARMEKTGESYTAARAQLLAGDEPGTGASRSPPPTRRSASAPAAAGRSGSTSSTTGAPPTRSHREIARWLRRAGRPTRWPGTSQA